MEKILIADNDKNSLKFIRDILVKTRHGCKIRTVHTSDKIIANTIEFQPDIILMDLEMEGLIETGICNQVKENPISSSTPIIMMTNSNSDPAIKAAMLNKGADAFLARPFDVHTLNAQINVLIRMKSTEEQLRKERDKLKAINEQQSKSINENQERWRLIQKSINDGIWDWDIENNHIYTSALWNNLLGYEIRRINSMNELYSIIFQEHLSEFIEKLQSYLNKQISNFDIELKMMCADNSYKWMLLRGVGVWDENDKAIRIIGTMANISERRALIDSLERMAHVDSLTNLPNRNLFYDRLRLTIAHGKRFQHIVAMLFLDLDGFKEVNDNFGHDIGDNLLKEVAQRLLNAVREFDTVARLGGDEFAIILQELHTTDDCAVICKRVLFELSRTFEIKNNLIHISGSIGISLFPSDSQDMEELIKFADFSMYQAKNAGKNSFIFYSKVIDDKTRRKQDLERELTKAILNKEFKLFFQPIIDLSNGNVAGLETLLRWDHPVKGLLMPEYFISLFQDSGLIISLDYWVLKEISQQIKIWEEAGLPSVRISLNLSKRELLHQSLIKNMQKLIETNELNPYLFLLEIREDVIFSDLEKTAEAIDNFHQMGFKIAIDNFGTGFLSFQHLMKLHIDYIKIDLSFIQQSVIDAKTRRVVAAVRSMAYDLGIKIIAEGVETVNQLNMISILNYDELQGYLFSKALPAAEIGDVIRKNMFAILKEQDAPFFADRTR